MTDKTVLERALASRLHFLDTLQLELDLEDARTLRALLIGALSAHCSDEQWEASVESALNLLADDREHRPTCACHQSPGEPVS